METNRESEKYEREEMMAFRVQGQREARQPRTIVIGGGPLYKSQGKGARILLKKQNLRSHTKDGEEKVMTCFCLLSCQHSPPVGAGSAHMRKARVNCVRVESFSLLIK